MFTYLYEQSDIHYKKQSHWFTNVIFIITFFATFFSGVFLIDFLTLPEEKSYFMIGCYVTALIGNIYLLIIHKFHQSKIKETLSVIGFNPDNEISMNDFFTSIINFVYVNHPYEVRNYLINEAYKRFGLTTSKANDFFKEPFIRKMKTIFKELDKDIVAYYKIQSNNQQNGEIFL